MKSITIIIFLIGLGFLHTNCSDVQSSTISITGCCENDPLAVTFGNAQLFLPNIFTPDNDGLNDRFIPIGDSIQEIIDFEIKDPYGRTIFHHTHIPLWSENSAWDGYVNGEVKRGLYSYSISVEAMNGIIETYSGQVCNFPCTYPSNKSISSENCFTELKWFCIHGPWHCEPIYDCFN